MVDPNASLADIAGACGFADQSHLTRAFKSITGSPPGVFRDLVARR
jgi:transcriptional regulator GlxA family with amidase domain